MAKRKPVEEKKGLDEWMATYGDMVTLLLCFFVLLFSMSTVDAQKFQSMASSMANALSTISSGASAGVLEALGNGIIEMPTAVSTAEIESESIEQSAQELTKMASDFKTYFAENNVAEEVIEVEITSDAVILRFKDGMLFDSGKAVLRSDALAALDIVANELINHPGNDIKIEGHTDNMPISTLQFPSNWHLSSARATSVAIYFIDTRGFDPMKMSTEGFGEYRPIDTNDTPEGRAKNRRVEIKIMSEYYSNNNNIQ